MKKYKDVVLYIVLIVLLFVWAVTKLQPKIVEYADLFKSVKEKTIERDDLKRKLDSYKQAEERKATAQVGLIKKIYRPESGMGDAESVFSSMFDLIIEYARYNGIKTRSIEYIYNPPEDEFVKGAGGRYNVCQLNLQMVGDYSDFESFLKDLYKYPYLIGFSKIEITPYEKNKKILLINLELRLYASNG